MGLYEQFYLRQTPEGFWQAVKVGLGQAAALRARGAEVHESGNWARGIARRRNAKLRKRNAAKPVIVETEKEAE